MAFLDPGAFSATDLRNRHRPLVVWGGLAIWTIVKWCSRNLDWQVSVSYEVQESGRRPDFRAEASATDIGIGLLLRQGCDVGLPILRKSRTIRGIRAEKGNPERETR